MDCPCDFLEGRKRDICRGHDDDGNPVLTPAKRAAYLSRWCSERLEGNEQDIGKDQKETTDNRVRGLGDVVAKITRATGIDRVVKIVERATGKPCGCSERRKRLNQLVPFGDSQDAPDDQKTPRHPQAGLSADAE